MHDLKHINRKNNILTGFSRTFKKRNSKNSIRKCNETKRKKVLFKTLLPLLACLLVASTILLPLKIFPSFFAGKKFRSEPAKSHEQKGSRLQALHLALESFRSARVVDNHLESALQDGSSLIFSVDVGLQQSVQRVMEEKEVPYGVFVAIQPKTGKVLALTGYSSIDPTWCYDACFRLYPMASLFKIITASAALEMKKVEPKTSFAYRGYSYSENPKYWSVAPGRGAQQMSLSLAMGKSINPVFGRLASDVVGKETIMVYANRFGFNQNLFPGTNVNQSRAAVPQTDFELRLMGAGLGREVKISPFHAALMIAAVANQGAMMEPMLATEIRDRERKEISSAKPREMRRLITQETAGQLSEMLLTTVTSGTSRRAFHDRQGRPKLASIKVCAKTGSINGTEPEGSYSWFAAYAPSENPQIALVALIINRDKWRIKASYLGEQALEHFFSGMI